MKKVLSAVLVLVMVFAIIPLGANAAIIEGERGTPGMTDPVDYIVGVHELNIEDWTMSGKTGDCTWTLVDDVLTISGKGAMADYESPYNLDYPELLEELYLGNCSPWFWKSDNIKDLIIEEGVTHIGAFAFEGFKITSITIPDSVTSFGSLAFINTSSINIKIPYGVETIDNRAFGLNMFQSIELPDTVKYIEVSALGHINKLTDVYYTGSKEDKNKIVFDGKDYLIDEFLNEVTWHYNTCRVHTYIDSCDTTCEKCDITREIQHTFDDKFDAECNICKATRKVPQKNKETDEKKDASSESSKKADTVAKNKENNSKNSTSQPTASQDNDENLVTSDTQAPSESVHDTDQSGIEKKENSQLPIGIIIVTTVVTAAILCGGAMVFYFIKRRKHE